MKKGFSLVELLISLIVISLITVALMPIFTKKIGTNSMTVKVADSKKGLQIYSNPGTYAFDVPTTVSKVYFSGAGGGGGGAGAIMVTKSVNYETNATFSVPKGVSSITLKITGSGGGGGAANAVKNETACYNSTFFLAMRGAQNEEDICYMKGFVDVDEKQYCTHPYAIVLNPQEVCNGGRCAWRRYSTVDSSSLYTAQATASTNGMFPTEKKSIFTPNAAKSACDYYNPSGSGCVGVSTGGYMKYNYRLPTYNELKKIAQYLDAWNTTKGADGLNLCTRDYPNYNNNADKRISYCQDGSKCVGTSNSWCFPFAIGGIGVTTSFSRLYYDKISTGPLVESISDASANITDFAVKCAKTLNRYSRFSGSGGASGAQITQTIAVIPGDTFAITIGEGGAGGVYSSSKNNGVASRAGNGQQGATTQVVHKRNGTVIGTYYVKGGFGGYGATTSAQGETISTTTPSGTCYANGNINCSINSFSGTAGTETKGGNGARVANSGTISDGGASSGGYVYVDTARTATQRYTTTELNYAKGQAGSTAGFGGGGALSAPWICEGSNCTQTAPVSLFTGGTGAKGRVDITYNVVLPGGGGGAGAALGLSSSGELQEVEYSVTPGSRIVFTIGKGGLGGASEQAGYPGNPTTIMEDQIIFNPGQGGKLGDISTLATGAGGSGGTFVIKSSIKSKTKILNVESSKMATAGNGEAGYSGQLKDASGAYLSYGLDGGVGGTTFIGYFGGCGAGMVSDNNTLRACETSSKKDGVDAATHNAVKNQYGGSGGGGGGATSTSIELGSGGAGSDGFLRIRWGS